MKTVTYEVAGRKCSLLLSVYSTKKLVAQYGSLQDVGKKIIEMRPEEQLTALVSIIALLAESGRKYAEIIGENELPAVITAEELECVLPMSPETLAELMEKVTATFDTKGDLEIKPDKNSKN